jgi:hypothetical protein
MAENNPLQSLTHAMDVLEGAFASLELSLATRLHAEGRRYDLLVEEYQDVQRDYLALQNATLSLSERLEAAIADVDHHIEVARAAA